MSNANAKEAIEITAEHINAGNNLYEGFKNGRRMHHHPAIFPHALVGGRVFVLRTSVQTREQAQAAISDTVSLLGAKMKDVGFGLSIDADQSLEQGRSIPDSTLVGLWKAETRLPRMIKDRLIGVANG